jgi:hypothetical protein
MIGRYKQRELEVSIAEMTDINAQDKYTSDEIFDFASEDEDKPSDFESPTQYGKTILSGPTIWGKMKSPNPAMNIPRPFEPVATDSV